MWNGPFNENSTSEEEQGNITTTPLIENPEILSSEQPEDEPLMSVCTKSPTMIIEEQSLE